MIWTMLRALKQPLSYLDTRSYRDHDERFVRISMEEFDHFDADNDSDYYLRCKLKQKKRIL